MNFNQAVIKSLQPTLSMLKNIQPAIQMAKNLQPTLNMVKTLSPVLEASHATSALHAVTGSIAAPLLSNQ